MKLLLLEANDMRKWVGGRVGKEVHVVPVALLTLAAYARRETAGLEVCVAESSLDAATDEELVRLLDEMRPDWVGLRGINFFLEETRRLMRVLRAWGRARILVGGPMVSALRERLFDLVPEIDLAVVGEGERALVELLRGTDPGTVAGVLQRGGGGVTSREPGPPLQDLDGLPWADYSLIDLDRYARHLSYAYNQRRQAVLVTSRGCPYRCTYCFQPPGSRVRLRSAADVFGEIEALCRDHDVHDFYVIDDVFNLSRRRVVELCARLAEAQLGVRLYFVNGLRVDRCDEELCDRLVAAGAVWVTFGIESAHPRIARMIRKEIDLEHARRVIDHAQSTGMVVNVDTMFGFPTETAAEAQATLDWIGTLSRPSLLPYHFNLRGYAGCEIVEQAVAAGWDREAFLETGMSSYHELPAGSPTFSRQEMLTHWLQYHERFGLKNREHLRFSVERLRAIGYSEVELRDMYAVLLNRPLQSVADLLASV